MASIKPKKGAATRANSVAGPPPSERRKRTIAAAARRRRDIAFPEVETENGVMGFQRQSGGDARQFTCQSLRDSYAKRAISTVFLARSGPPAKEMRTLMVNACQKFRDGRPPSDSSGQR
jgi:hypothetical protein